MIVFYGNAVHAPSLAKLEILQNVAIGVDHNGKIVFVRPDADINQIREEFGSAASDKVVQLKNTEFLIPGFIDTHIHAPQYKNAGLALDLPLLQWLEKYTFPTESLFANLDFAREIYHRVVACTLANGTTTALYFATLHTPASLELCNIAEDLGQRAYVGKVSMDAQSPAYYTEDSQAAFHEAEKFIIEVKSRKYSLVEPVVTPRFAVSCTMGLMRNLAGLSQKHDVLIQTHTSENKEECDFVVQLHPGHSDYTDIYAKAGLLTPKTVLAHAVYMEDSELDTIGSCKSSVSHCPNSNCSIRSGLCDVRRMVAKGIHVGLGTDVSGGYSPSILNSMRFAITVSNILAMQREGYTALNFREVIYMATMGGALALGIGDKVGSFEVGKDFDALVIDLASTDGNIELWAGETMEELVSKFVHLGDDRHIKEVYVKGREVKRNSIVLLEKLRRNLVN